ncbi:protein ACCUMULATION AND REPLICATION OF CHLOROPLASTS 3 [Arachis ipaensis]|uniref:protein ACCUMULATION AND REPLICATION OF CHLOROPLASTS 3 n=1 Tax=Arachis ipaensis TaxID=130454 RepID=UPI0007AF1580|nr:protein ACCUMULATION AND REPLICATION OF CHLOROPLASTS 3 [Arachis ipaensis]
MELSAFPTFRAVTNPSIFPFSSKQVCCRCSFFLRRRDYGLRWNRNSKPFVRIRLCLENASSSNGYGGTESGEAKPEFIEVIGIGSRKDAVIDFCLRSQFQLSSLRFWNILMKESHEAQLQRRSREEEFSPTVVKAPVFMKTCSKTVVLVASAGYGLDLTVAVDIFETLRSRNGLAVAIVLRPFSFEGLRRQDEVKDLMGKLKESADLIIEIDIDALLQKDLLTLDEAMKTANNAVLLAIKAIYVLKSEMHRKLVDRLQDGVTEASTSEVNKILANYKEAGIGFGAAYNIKTSILQSTLECPFLGVRLKDPTSIVICILASSVPINHSDIAAFLRTFRQTTAYTGDILVSTIYEPNVEPNLWITTVLALGSSNVKQSVQSVGILSRLALHFPRLFSFWGTHNQQGLRRQDEVKDLMGKLKESADLIIEIDIDALLQKDLLTLDEAMKTANNAVLLAIKAIYVLKSEMHRKLVDRLQDGVTEASTSEVNKILANYKEAGIGFGAAYNIKTSILQSTLECPFLGVRLKDPTSIVICILASSVPINHSDIAAFLRTFRQTTAYTGDILVSTIYEPNVEPNLWITTVLALGSSNVKQSVQSVGILSRLALHFPRLFSFWGTHNQQQVHTGKECAVTPQKVMESYERDEEPNKNAAHFVDGSFNNHNEQLEPRVSSSSSKLATSRFSEKEDMFDSIAQNSVPYDSIIEDDYAFQREQLENWNLGPGYEVAREWAQERVADATHMIDNLSIFHLPVGVRPSEDLKDCLKVSFMTEQKEPESVNEVNVSTINEGIPSWNVVTDASLEAVKGLASSLLKGKDANKPKKHGVLSDRAASMLEAERDLSKKWNPVVEMQYRGGRYKGRCQGGLPEGKGRLILGDGSIYDGSWRHGKRSGPGTFYFKNGDMFQGTWRDDVMHGKGWFYFHTGDRWFANFWKGKANGEGRFYSKSGDAFFGNFKDGWRHGQFLCIDANGTRYTEIWKQGVLLDIKQLYR